MSKSYTPWFTSQIKEWQGTPPHLKYATDLTKYGTPNHDAASKGFFRRHGRQRELARKGAKWNMPTNSDGKLPFPNKAKGAIIYFGV